MGLALLLANLQEKISLYLMMKNMVQILKLKGRLGLVLEEQREKTLPHLIIMMEYMIRSPKLRKKSALLQVDRKGKTSQHQTKKKVLEKQVILHHTLIAHNLKEQMEIKLTKWRKGIQSKRRA